MEYMAPLFKLVLLSILIERFLAVFFDLTGAKELLQANVNSSTLPSGQPRKFSAKGLIAAFVGVVFCLSTGFEVINEILKSPPTQTGVTELDPIMAQIITGFILAGGSQGSVKLFQDILGFSKENRDLLKQTANKQQEATQIRADAEKKAAEVEHLKQTVALARLTLGSNTEATPPGGGETFPPEIETLMATAIPNMEERAILRHVAERVRGRSRR